MLGKDKPPVIEGKHFRIRSLECIDELNERLKAHVPIKAIATWLIEEKGEYADVTYNSLCVLIGRYKADILTPMEKSGRRIIKQHGNDLNKAVKSINELDQLETLYTIQMDRINKGGKYEKKLKMLSKGMNTEIALAVSILLKRHSIKMDLGVNGGRDLGTLSVRPEFAMELKEKHGDELLEVFNNPESRSKVHTIVNLMIKNAKEKIIDVEFEEINDEEDLDKDLEDA